MTSTPNYNFYLPADRERGWGQLVRDSFTKIDGLILVLRDAINTKADIGHTHELNDINGMAVFISNTNNAINGKANLVHYHAISDVTGLVEVLAGINAHLTAHDTAIYALQTNISALQASLAALVAQVGQGTTSPPVTTTPTPLVNPTGTIQVAVSGNNLSVQVVNLAGDRTSSIDWQLNLLNTGQSIQYNNTNTFNYTRPGNVNNTQFSVVLKLYRSDGVAFTTTQSFLMAATVTPPPTVVTPTTVSGVRNGGGTDVNAAYTNSTWFIRETYRQEADVQDNGHHTPQIDFARLDASFNFSNLYDATGATITRTTVTFNVQRGPAGALPLTPLRLYVAGVVYGTWAGDAMLGSHTVDIPPYAGGTESVTLGIGDGLPTINGGGGVYVNNISLALIH